MRVFVALILLFNIINISIAQEIMGNESSYWPKSAAESVVSVVPYSEASDSALSTGIFDGIQNILLDVIVFNRNTRFLSHTGTTNPTNRIAKLKRSDGGLYIRPTIKYLGDELSVWFKPRLNFDVDLDESIGALGERDNYNNDLFVQELKGKFQFGNDAYLLIGRYTKELGPSVLYNPSNPFVVENGRLNPKLEIDPMDFAEISVALSLDWEMTFIANLGRADNKIFQDPFFEFNKIFGIMVDYYGLSESYSAIASTSAAENHHVAFFGQKNISDALLIWGEVALDKNINRFYAVETSLSNTVFLEYDVINGPDNQQWFATVLLGASYTLNIGPTLTFEYFYRESGLDDNQASVFFDMIDYSSRQNLGATQLLANRNLGRAINTGQPYLRQKYFFTQVGESDLFGALSYIFRYTHSLDDDSGQYSAVVEWNMTDSLELFLVGISNRGGKNTDFGRLIDHQIMTGIIKRI